MCRSREGDGVKRESGMLAVDEVWDGLGMRCSSQARNFCSVCERGRELSSPRGTRVDGRRGLVSRAPMSCLPNPIQSQGRSDVRADMNRLSAFAGVSVAEDRGTARVVVHNVLTCCCFSNGCSTSGVL